MRNINPSPTFIARWNFLLLSLLMVGLLSLAPPPAARAQGVIGTYTFTGAAGNEVTFPVDAQPTNATFSPMRRGTGVTPSASANRFAATGFTLDSVALDTAQYFAFRVTAASGFQLNLDSLTFTERRSGAGIRKYQVRSSVNSYATALTTVRVPNDTNIRPAKLGLNATFSGLRTVEFRFYGYGAAATTGTWRLDDVRLVGRVLTGGAIVPTLSFSTASRTVVESAGLIQVPVTLTNPSATAATTVLVGLATAPGTATAGTDYTFTPRTLTFPAGSSAPQNVPLTILDDNQSEGFETVVLELRNPSTGALLGSPAATTITIDDNDGPPLRTIASVTVNDAQGVPTSMNTTVRLRGTVTSPNTRTAGYNLVLVDRTGGVTVFKTRFINNGQELTLGDSVEVSGLMTHFRGLTEIIPDTFLLLAQNQPLVTPRVVTVLDETTESELVQINGPLTLVDATQWTNTGSGFNVDVTDGTRTYAMRIVNNTNLFGTAPPTLPFRLVGTGGQFDVTTPLLGDYQILPRSLADIQLVGVPVPAVQFSPVTRTVAETAGTIQVPVSITNPSTTTATTVQVTLATRPGTATAGADYTFATQTLTFPAGSASAQNATLTVLNDFFAEPAETVRLTLTNVTGGTADTTTFVLDILANDTTTLRFGTVARTVAENAGSVLVPVRLRNPSATQPTTVTVALATPAGTATAGADYTFAAQTLTFPAGDTTTRTATLVVLEDVLMEGPETVRLQLSGASAGARLDGTAFTLNLTDNDTTTLRFGAVARTVAENAGTVLVPVRLRNPSATQPTTVTVALATPTGTATTGADYTFAAQTLTFPAGDTTTRTATLVVLEDVLTEGPETVRLQLSGASTGARLDGPAFTLNITDNDTIRVGFGSVARSVAESAGTIQVPVRLRNPSPTLATVVEVALAAVSGTATAGTDYTFAARTLTFAPGDTATQQVALTVVDDVVDENTETVVLTLRNPSTGVMLRLNGFTLSIRDNDTTIVPIPVLAFGPVPARVAESAGTVRIPVTLRNASATQATQATVRLATPAGTATPGADYTFTRQTLTFAAGDTARQFATLTVLDDATDEPDETVLLLLDSASTGAVVSAGSVGFTIQDNDTTLIANLAFGAASRTVTEGAVTLNVPVTIVNPSLTQPFTVRVKRAGAPGTATAGLDYTFAAQTLTFPAGAATTQNAVLTLLDDNRVERTETIVLLLDSASAGAQVGLLSSYTLRILDNDTARIRFRQTARTVTESAGTVSIPVGLTAPVDTAAVSVQLTLDTPPGTATAGTDYTFAPQTLVFPIGDTTAQVATLALLDDAAVEGPETVLLALTGTAERFTLTIQDNDTSRVQFAGAAQTVAENAGTVQIPVTLTNPGPNAVTVEVMGTGGTATAGTDYTFAPQTLTFAPGTTTQNAALTIIDDTQQEPAETVTLMLMPPTGGAVLGTTVTFTLTITDNDTGPGPLTPPLTTIAAVTVNDANGVPLLNGQAVRVRGIVTGPNIRTTGYQTSLQDAGQGIGLFRSAALSTQTIAQGDSLEVIGIVGQFNGLTQIVIDSFRTRAVAQRLPAPRPTPTLDEVSESLLTRLTGGPFTVVDPTQWTNAGSGFTVDITNGTATYALRIVRGTNVYGSPAPTQPFNLVGIGGQFDNAAPFDSGYQIIPRSLDDIEIVTGLIADAPANTLMLWPNPATDQLTISGDAPGETVTVFDGLGRAVLTVARPTAGAPVVVRVGALPAGVYTVRVGTATRRFVKQ